MLAAENEGLATLWVGSFDPAMREWGQSFRILPAPMYRIMK